jgi:hypothetical protein
MLNRKSKRPAHARGEGIPAEPRNPAGSGGWRSLIPLLYAYRRLDVTLAKTGPPEWPAETGYSGCDATVYVTRKPPRVPTVITVNAGSS